MHHNLSVTIMAREITAAILFSALIERAKH